MWWRVVDTMDVVDGVDGVEVGAGSLPRFPTRAVATLERGCCVGCPTTLKHEKRDTPQQRRTKVRRWEARPGAVPTGELSQLLR